MNEYRILVTGSRNLGEEYREAIYDVLDYQISRATGTPVIIHGACPTGADKFADDYARERYVGFDAYPADWSQGKSAGPKRNKKMVALGADVVLAFPYGESRGTWNCVHLARSAGLNVLIYEVEEEDD